MLRIHSRMSAAEKHVVTYRAGAFECDAPTEHWTVLKKAEGPWTCLLASDMSLVNASLGAPDCTYTAVGREHGRARVPARPDQFRVTGNVTAHIYWEHAGDIQLIVETAATVYFHSSNARAQLVVAARDRGRVALMGRVTSVVVETDTYSCLDASRLHSTKPIRVSFRGAITSPLSFPHAESDCARVTDDTPAEQQCGTCCERVRNAVFSPCGHDYMCLVCADRYQKSAVLGFTCPLCRARVTDVAPR